MSASTVVNRYLDAFYSADMNKASAEVAATFVFQGPFVATNGRERFFAAASGLVPVLRGHKLLSQLESGEQVCSLIEVFLKSPDNSGSVLMTEWNRVVDGKLQETKLLFDTGAFRRILPAA